MAIGVDSGADVAVSYPILDTLHRNLVRHHQTYARMPEIVKSDMGESGLFQQITVSIGDIVRVSDFS